MIEGNMAILSRARKEALPKVQHGLFVPTAFGVVGSLLLRVTSTVRLGKAGETAVFEAPLQQGGHRVAPITAKGGDDKVRSRMEKGQWPTVMKVCNAQKLPGRRRHE